MWLEFPVEMGSRYPKELFTAEPDTNMVYTTIDETREHMMQMQVVIDGV